MTGRNPDLPILDELGAEFVAMVSVAWASDQEGAPATVTAPGSPPNAAMFSCTQRSAAI